MKKNKNALISVYDKINLEDIARFLIKKKYTIYSTGGSSNYLKKINIPHVEISKFTKQKEILNGRVKTLHPKIFGGILAANSQDHQKELKVSKIPNFDLLIVNLYPFEETIKKTKNADEIIEMIDIGGHSLIRAAVKNYLKTLGHEIDEKIVYKQRMKKASREVEKIINDKNLMAVALFSEKSVEFLIKNCSNIPLDKTFFCFSKKIEKKVKYLISEHTKCVTISSPIIENMAETIATKFPKMVN